MLVFSTRLPLKQEVSQEICLELFIDWVIQSEHYPISNIAYDVSSHEDYHIEEGKISFSISHYKDDKIELSACRLENNETNAVWINDCIFLQEQGIKTLLIQLNCNRLDFSIKLPLIHKPYIVRKFVEGGFCRDDASILVTDSPIEVNDSNFDLCASIMRCELNYTMPVVYVSCDYWGSTAISAGYLAKQLSGVAHVFVETNHEIALKLREVTGGKNAHNGYIGVYFPGSEFCQKFCLDYFEDYKVMGRAVIDSVWRALINRIDSSVYNWNQIMTLQARQKMNKWKVTSLADKEELEKYMSFFDSENEELSSKIHDLNEQNANLRAQLDAMRLAIQAGKDDSGFYKMGSEPDLYPGEHTELLYSILSQVQAKYETNSRAYSIIQSLLTANKPIGECSRILEGLKTVLYSGDRLNASTKSTLKDMGFIIEEDGGTHYKLTFHEPRYMFTVSKTPSDHREGKNLYSDICKILDITKKIL